MIRAVEPAIFSQVFGEQVDPLARFVSATVPFPRQLLCYFEDGQARPVARVAASVSLDGGSTGAIGFLAGERKHFLKLINQAESWLKTQGCKMAVGPMVYATWFPYRARLFNEESVVESPNFSWEPAQPRGEEKVWSDAGYRLFDAYASRGLSGLIEFAAHMRPFFTKVKSAGFTVQTFQEGLATPESRSAFLDALFDLTMESFAGAHLFTPITREQFKALYVAGFSGLGDLSLGVLLRAPDGRPAAFGFSFIDQGHLIIKTLATARAFRGQGLSNAVISHACEGALRQGIDKMVHALMRKGNLSEGYAEKAELLWEHRYGLFAKDL